MEDSLKFDAVVIGAGVVGLAIANELCDIFENVLVLDKESSFGQHVSSRHSGVIHSGIYYEPGSLKARLCVQGNDLIYDFATRNKINHLNCGKLIVGHNDVDLQKLKTLMGNAIENGVQDLALLSHEEALEVQPGLKCQNALWVPSTGIIDSHELMNCLEKKVITKKGIVYYNSKVISIDRVEDSYTILIDNQDIKIRSQIIINSAGLWCDEISTMVGINKYKIHYCKGDYYQSTAYKNLKCLIYPLPAKIGLGIHTVLQLDGSVSFGPNAYYVEEIDYDIDNRNLDSFHSSINKYLDIKKKDLKVDYTGIRPKPFASHEAPMDFVIKNESELGFPNFVNLIGIESPGLTSALAIAKYVISVLE